MHEALLIARREYVERIRSRAFRISTVLIPVAFGFIFGIGALSGKLSGGPKHIVVASNDSVLAESERAELIAAGKGSQLIVDVRAPIAEADLAALNADVDNKTLDGYLWLEVRPGTRQLETTYTSRGSADFMGKDRMQDSIGHALVREELMKRGATS
jgi:ABC-2 type transport system permease protein